MKVLSLYSYASSKSINVNGVRLVAPDLSHLTFLITLLSQLGVGAGRRLVLATVVTLATFSVASKSKLLSQNNILSTHLL